MPNSWEQAWNKANTPTLYAALFNNKKKPIEVNDFLKNNKDFYVFTHIFNFLM